ncbi:MAG: hypothetical protein Kow0022_03890 [Phycisphaerales bacterium]
MPTFVARVVHQDTGRNEYLIREAAAEHDVRTQLEHAGLVVRSLRPAAFGGQGPRFMIRSPEGRVAGPFGLDILRAMVLDGLLTPHWHCSLQKSGGLETHSWHPAWKVKGLFPGHVIDSIRRSHAVEETDDEVTAKLKALKRQLDSGLIDERDYRFKKGELLGTPYEIDGVRPMEERGHNTNALAVRTVDPHFSPDVLPARRVINTMQGQRIMYCTDCGTQLLDRAVICPSCGCPTQNYKSHTGQDFELTPGRIAACYAVGFLFPLGGFIASIYLFVKGRVEHGIGILLLSVFSMFFWLAALE